MEVMLWFHEHFQHFSSLMQEKESDNEDDGENEGETSSHVMQPNLKEVPLASVDEISVLKEEEHAGFKVERRKLIDHSGRFNPLKEEVKETDERPILLESVSKQIPCAAPKKTRFILSEETKDLPKPPHVVPLFDLPVPKFDFKESYVGPLPEENVITVLLKTII